MRYAGDLRIVERAVVIRFRYAVPVVVLALAAAAGFSYPASAAPKAPALTPAPAAASPSPIPSPTGTPEALDKAIPRLEGVVKANPNDKQSQAELATDYLQINRPDLAVAITQKLLAAGTKTAQMYYIDGAAQSALGKTKEATASLEQAANLEPTNVGVLQTLTQFYLRDNRAADAERIAKRAITFNASSKDAIENYGAVLGAEKKYDEARQQFEAAAKLDPKDAHPIVLEARTYSDSNAIALAAQLYDRAIAVDPKSLEALVGKAELASAQHNVKDAVATYETVLGLETTDQERAAVLDEIAKVYAREKMDTEADAAFRRAIDTYPAVYLAHVPYGDYLASKSDKAGAMREWTAGAGPNHDNPDALGRLGDAAVQANDMPKALGFYKRLAEVASNDPRAYLLVGQAQMANKNFTAARDAFRSSYNLQHTPDALIGLAASDQQTRNYKEAIQIYEAINRTAPDFFKQNPGLLYNMGKAYQSNNQPQQARDAYVKLLGLVKPGTTGETEVKKLIAEIDRAKSGGTKAAASSPKPASSKAPKPKK